MVKVIQDRVKKEDLAQLQEAYKGYIKVVIDLEKGVVAAGGEYHVDCEQVLIARGSKQSNLWGGGYDVATGQLDYFAMSNYRPAEGRVTYEIADQQVREKFQEIVYRYFPSSQNGQ